MSTCIRRQIGAVLVRDKRILVSGYNGAPSNLPHCTDKGMCIRDELNIPSGTRQEVCRALHAEQSVIAQAARYGIKIDGADLYCMTQPCSICAKMLINVGVKNVFYGGLYNDDISIPFMIRAGIKVFHVHDNGHVMAVETQCDTFYNIGDYI
jgi:dCMP deaminase